ncbi:MAG: hypothetical protein ABIP94_04085, partial [Planctomycetota bacterium]
IRASSSLSRAVYFAPGFLGFRKWCGQFAGLDVKGLARDRERLEKLGRYAAAGDRESRVRFAPRSAQFCRICERGGSSHDALSAVAVAGGSDLRPYTKLWHEDGVSVRQSSAVGSVPRAWHAACFEHRRTRQRRAPHCRRELDHQNPWASPAPQTRRRATRTPANRIENVRQIARGPFGHAIEGPRLRSDGARQRFTPGH